MGCEVSLALFLGAQSGPCPSEVAECLQQPGRAWLAAQGPVCQGACAAHAFIAWSQPLVWGQREEGQGLELGVIRAVSFPLCSTTALPGAAQGTGALAALSSRVVEHSQGK